ncbi:hypothetical protein OAE35_03090 [Synechococcus sp. AH-551-E02]|nr:hypothetical protein [Synechococcus sp. AH-551-E02]MDB4653866.1 hypothetical protein [Synechococcus sp. AH-551-E02]
MLSSYSFTIMDPDEALNRGNVLITTLISRLVGWSVLDPDRPDASATPAILGTQFRPDSPADTFPSVLPKDCLGMPLV